MKEELFMLLSALKLFAVFCSNMSFNPQHNPAETWRVEDEEENEKRQNEEMEKRDEEGKKRGRG